MFEVETPEFHCAVRTSDAVGMGGGGGAGGAAPGLDAVPSELPDCPWDDSSADPSVEIDYEWPGSSITGITVWQYSAGLAKAVPWLRYRVLRDGQLLTEGEVEFDYEADEPNGPDCGYRYVAEETVSR